MLSNRHVSCVEEERDDLYDGGGHVACSNLLDNSGGWDPYTKRLARYILLGRL